MCGKPFARHAIANFSGQIVEPHDPQIMCITCIDGREKAGGNFAFGNNAIRVTEIAAVIPPYEHAPNNTRAKFSFRKLKEVSVIQVTGHSFCGGAQTAIAFPDVDNPPDEEVRDIVQSLADSGADIPCLCAAFLNACEGDASNAANLLSRHLVLVSLDNISRYPHVHHQIEDGKLETLALYHEMNQSTGKRSHLERFDFETQEWVKAGSNAFAHVWKGVGPSLDWVKTPYMQENGQVGEVALPSHIAGHVKRHMAQFQPRLFRTNPD